MKAAVSEDRDYNRLIQLNTNYKKGNPGSFLFVTLKLMGNGSTSQTYATENLTSALGTFTWQHTYTSSLGRVYDL